MEKRGRLTPPVIAPPLRHVIGFAKGSWQVVVRPFVRQRKICRAEEHDKGELRQVDLMDLLEDLLPHPWICRGLFLGKQLVQGRIAVEVNVESGGRELVARPQGGIVGVVGRVRGILKLGDVIPARYSSRGRRCLSSRPDRTKVPIGWIVLDVELDGKLLEVVLNDGFNVKTKESGLCLRSFVVELNPLSSSVFHSGVLPLWRRPHLHGLVC